MAENNFEEEEKQEEEEAVNAASEAEKLRIINLARAQAVDLKQLQYYQILGKEPKNPAAQLQIFLTDAKNILQPEKPLTDLNPVRLGEAALILREAWGVYLWIDFHVDLYNADTIEELKNTLNSLQNRVYQWNVYIEAVKIANPAGKDTIERLTSARGEEAELRKRLDAQRKDYQAQITAYQAQIKELKDELGGCKATVVAHENMVTEETNTSFYKERLKDLEKERDKQLSFYKEQLNERSKQLADLKKERDRQLKALQEEKDKQLKGKDARFKNLELVLGKQAVEIKQRDAEIKRLQSGQVVEDTEMQTGDCDALVTLLEKYWGEDLDNEKIEKHLKADQARHDALTQFVTEGFVLTNEAGVKEGLNDAVHRFVEGAIEEQDNEYKQLLGGTKKTVRWKIQWLQGQLRRCVTDSEAEKEHCNTQVQGLQVEVNRLKTENEQLQAAKNQAERDKTEAVKKAKADLDAALQRINELDQELTDAGDLETELTGVRNDLQEANQRAATLQKQAVTEAEEKGRREAKSEAEKECKDQVQQLNTQLQEAGQRVLGLEETIRNNQITRRETDNASKETARKFDTLKETHVNTVQELNRVNGELTTALQRIDELQGEGTALQTKGETLEKTCNQRITALQMERETLQGSIDELKGIIQTMERNFRGEVERIKKEYDLKFERAIPVIKQQIRRSYSTAWKFIVVELRKQAWGAFQKADQLRKEFWEKQYRQAIYRTTTQQPDLPLLQDKDQADLPLLQDKDQADLQELQLTEFNGFKQTTEDVIKEGERRLAKLQLRSEEGATAMEIDESIERLKRPRDNGETRLVPQGPKKQQLSRVEPELKGNMETGALSAGDIDDDFQLETTPPTGETKKKEGGQRTKDGRLLFEEDEDDSSEEEEDEMESTLLSPVLTI